MAEVICGITGQSCSGLVEPLNCYYREDYLVNLRETAGACAACSLPVEIARDIGRSVWFSPDAGSLAENGRFEKRCINLSLGISRLNLAGISRGKLKINRQTCEEAGVDPNAFYRRVE